MNARLRIPLICLLATALCLAGAIAVAADNTVASSTMIFESAGGYTLTDNGDGTYSGVLPMVDEATASLGDLEAGYDVYGRNGASAWFGDDSGSGPVWSEVAIGTSPNDHDAWDTWDPDTPDWYQYSIAFYDDGGVQKWAVRNHPGDNATDDPWWENGDGDTQDPRGVPLSGVMDWANAFAAETDTGAYLPGTGTAEIPGGAATKGGGPACWDMDWSWGSEVVPLEETGFDVVVADLGGGNYRVTLTPAAPDTVWVDDDFTAATTGWGATHFDTIQGGVDAVSDGGTVNVAAGTYLEEVVVAAKDNVTLNGAGQANTLIAPFREFTDDSYGITIDDAHSITIRDLLIDGGANGTLTAGVAHYKDGIHYSLVGGNDATITHVTIKNCDRRGISVWPETITGTEITYCTIDNVTAVTYGYGHGVKWCGTGKVENCTISNVTAGIMGACDAVGDMSFQNNTITDLTGLTDTPFDIGINIWCKHSNNITVKNNTITAAVDDNTGIYIVRGGDGSEISGNTISLTGDGGIGIETGWEYGWGFPIQNNTITMGRGGAGILVTGSGIDTDPMLICDNTLSNVGADDAFTNDYAGFSFREVGLLLSSSKWTSRTGDAHYPLWATVSGNTVIGFRDGIVLASEPYDAGGYNDIHVTSGGNAVMAFETAASYGILYDSDPGNYVFVFDVIPGTDPNYATQDLTSCYWDSASPDFGAIIDGKIDHSPWWCADYVGDDHSSPWTWGTDDSIQDAIDAASSGDTVNVAAGTYSEHLTVGKSLTLAGSDRATTVLDGSSTGTAAYVSSSNVTLSGMTIQNAGATASDAGVALAEASNCTVTDCIVTQNTVGIGIVAGDDNTVSDNLVAHNVYGIALDNAAAIGGDIADGATGCSITSNTVSDNTVFGIYIAENCHTTLVDGNTVSNTGESGIYFWKSSLNTVTNNTSTGNVVDGIHLFGSHDNTITGNTVTANVNGFEVRSGVVASVDNTISGNTISGNSSYAIKADENKSNVVGAENNWWGAASGPGPVGPGSGDNVTEYVDYSPWWAKADGSATASEGPNGEIIIPAGTSTADAQAIIDSAPSGAVIMLAAGAHTGGLVLNQDGITLIGEDGAIINSGSDSITVTADDVTIEDLDIDGSTGSGTDSGIVVADGVANLWVRNCAVHDWGQTGLLCQGAIDGLKVINSTFHNNGADGIQLADTPTGTVQIYGNSFRGNVGVGINNADTTSPSDVPAEYNEWGSVQGPTGLSGDGVSANVDYTPWVFGKLWVDAADTVREGDDTVVTIKMDVSKLFGTSFNINFDQTRLQLKSDPTWGTFGSGASGTGAEFEVTPSATANGSGLIEVRGNRGAGDAEYDAIEDVLLTLTFTAQEIVGTSESTSITLDTGDMSAAEAKVIYIDSLTADSISILGTTTATGVVDLQGRDDDSGATVDPGAGTTYGMDPASVTVGAWGTFGFANLTDDTYPSEIDAQYFLPASGDLTIAGDTQDLGTIKLLGGDATDDDLIDISDMTSIGGDYGEPVFDAWNDVNIDGEVDILDLVLAAGNYGESESPWTWIS